MGEVFQFFCWKTSSRIAKAEMYVSTRNFEGKHFIEKIVCVLSFFRKEQKFLAFWRKFFGRVLKTAFDVSVGSLWEFFFEK